MGELEMKLPAVALRGMVILPEMITHFDVTRVRSVKAVDRADAGAEAFYNGAEGSGG